MENLTGGTPPVRYLPCVVPCKLYFITFKTTDINDIITNTVGTIIRYFIARWITGSLKKRVLLNSKKSDFYVICSSVVVSMFLFQPFVSSLLWEMAV